MAAEDDRDLVGDRVQRFQDAQQRRPVVDVRGPVQRDDRVAGRPQAQPFEHVRVAGPLQVGDQRVDHDVADAVDALLGDALAPQVLVAVGRGGQQDLGESIGDHAVDLFGHGPVEAPQSGLDVGDGDAQLGADDAAGERRVDVADDDDQVGPLGLADLLELDHHARRLFGV